MCSRSSFNGAALRGARRFETVLRRVDSAGASMGPRSEERGDLVRVRAMQEHLAKLQWRRALRSAEIAPVSNFLAYCDEASMGPRSEERGDGTIIRATDWQVIA